MPSKPRRPCPGRSPAAPRPAARADRSAGRAPEARAATGRPRPAARRGGGSLVRVIRAEVVDQLFADQVPEVVLQPDFLDEEVMLRIDAGRVLRALEVEAEPLLDALHAGP